MKTIRKYMSPEANEIDVEVIEEKDTKEALELSTMTR